MIERESKGSGDVLEDTLVIFSALNVASFDE